MKKKQKNKRGTNKLFFKIISVLLILSAIISFGLIYYFEVIPITYLSVILILAGIIIFFFIKLLNNKRLRIWIKSVLSLIVIILIAGFSLISFYSLGTINFLNNIVDVGLRHDSYSVYVIDDKYKKIEDLNDLIIGVTDKEEEGTKKAIEKVSNKIEFNITEFDNVIDSIEALLENETDAVLLLDSNLDILKEDNEEYSKLKPIYTFTVTTKVETKLNTVDVSKENFVIYISGIDVNGKVISKARSDVNILVIVNPKDNKILMVNTPRDYYITLPSKKAKDKLTHAGIYGVEESMGALSDLYDVDIDYYVRVNFTTFIKIVEALDGIKVDVPVSFCEQTSSRTSSKQICLKKGLQTLNGEQALALSRTRHTLSGGDRSRIENQLLVLRAIIDKVMSPEIIVKYNDLLNSLSDSILTNIDQKSITTLIKKQIRNNTSWEFNTITVDGKDSSNTTYSTGRSRVYVMEPDLESVTKAKNMIDELLNPNEEKK